jgi:mannose-6-phosphate isomerase-like protein (cupin superfamily)
MKTRYLQIPAYITRDGSEIRELMHPGVHGNQNQSLAEATIPAGTRTLLHRHRRSEEIYHVTAGSGKMTLDGRIEAITVGDTVLIAPGSAHCVEATGEVPLRILCCCSPAYAHEDTELLDETASPP